MVLRRRHRHSEVTRTHVVEQGGERREGEAEHISKRVRHAPAVERGRGKANGKRTTRRAEGKAARKSSRAAEAAASRASDKRERKTMSGAPGGDVAGPAAEGVPGANGDRDSVDDVIERLLSVRGEAGRKGFTG